MKTVVWRMISHIDFNGPDLHAISAHVDEVFQDLNGWERTGKCPHKPSKIVVTASGDMAERVAKGVYCRYCGERLKIARIEWELESPLPMAPRSA